jgi:hypothetical protein
VPKASQSPSSSLFYYLSKEEVFEDRFDRSIVVCGIVGDEVSNTRLKIVFRDDFDDDFSLVFTCMCASKLTDREKCLMF